MRYPVWAPYVLILVHIIIVGIRTYKASDLSADSPMRPPAYGGQITTVLAVVVVFAVLMPSVFAGKLVAIIPLIIIAAVYYAVLYFAIPQLRKRISAVGCSCLWLVPGVLPFNLYVIMSTNKPLLWIDLSKAGSRILLAVLVLYLAVAVSLFVSKIVAHIRYRKKIMDQARSLAGTAAYPILEEETEKTGAFKDCVPDLYVSPEVAAPVSIGFFKRSRAILLPPEDFTPDELRIIFRHELIHMARNDCEAKLDMALVTSMLWPVPFIRRTSVSCAEDLELSCDELVLRGYSEADRKAYAELILSKSAENKGFSSCLSASAESLKYRLKHVMDPSPKRSGALLVCMAMLIVMLLFRSVGVSVYAGSGRDIVFGKSPLGTSVKWGMGFEEASSRFVSIPDPEKLNEYIAGLSLSHASWDDPAEHSGDDLYLEHNESGYDIRLRIAGDRILVSGPGVRSMGSYRVSGGIDWEYLRSLVCYRP